MQDNGLPVFVDTTQLNIAVLSYQPSGFLTLEPTDDTWVTESNPNVNHGSDDSLRVGKDAARESFLMFDCRESGGRVSSAKLRLYSENVAQIVHCKEVLATNWDEEGLDYENRPVMGRVIDSQSVVAGAWNEFDVAGSVTTAGIYAFGLEGTGGNKDFYSKEGAYPPELRVEYTGGFLNVDQPSAPAAEVTNDSSSMKRIASMEGAPVTNRNVHAIQGSDGVLVEFVAYDVAEDGIVQLVLLGADDQPLWDETASVAAGDRSYARFIVPGVEYGVAYNFIVRDETGLWWDASEVQVGAFAVEMLSAANAETTLSFSSLPDHDYEIQWVELLGEPC